jgi:hypothetical protein
MRTSLQKQSGLTLTGLIFGAALFGVVALMAMRLFPLYNEKMKVDMALDKVASDSNVAAQSKNAIVTAVMKQFEISDVDRWSTVEFTRLLQVVKDPSSGNRVMSLDYEIRNEVCCNLDIVLNYHWSRDLPRGNASD